MSRQLGAFGREYLSYVHESSRAAEIDGPNEYGAFPGTWLGMFLGESLLIVPDTNILRQDIDSAVKANRRGVLVSAANSGVFRLICAEHVIAEVQRQLREWADYQWLATIILAGRVASRMTVTRRVVVIGQIGEPSKPVPVCPKARPRRSGNLPKRGQPRQEPPSAMALRGKVLGDRRALQNEALLRRVP